MAKRRTVRADRFRAQMQEHVIGEDSLVNFEIGKGESIAVRLPVLIPQGDDFGDLLIEAQKSGDERELALLVLGYDTEGRTAEEQLTSWEAAGNDVADLALMWASETQAARERLGNFRYGA